MDGRLPFFPHPLIPEPLTLSGHDGADARPYQEEQVREAVRRACEEEGRQRP